MGKIMYRGEQFPGGPNLLSELRDVNFSNIQDKQIILYDSTSRTWKNHTITAADVAYDENNSVAETISSLNSALDNFFDVVQTVQSFAAATSLSYTGKSITIPAKSFYSLMFNISYSNSLPQEICLSKSPTDVNPYNVFGRSSTA